MFYHVTDSEHVITVINYGTRGKWRDRRPVRRQPCIAENSKACKGKNSVERSPPTTRVLFPSPSLADGRHSPPSEFAPPSDAAVSSRSPSFFHQMLCLSPNNPREYPSGLRVSCNGCFGAHGEAHSRATRGRRTLVFINYFDRFTQIDLISSCEYL
jgi:hypothetical protein